jgi:hypothetical protein
MNVLLKLRRMAALTLVLIMFGAGHQMSAEMPAVLNWNTSFTSFVEVNVSPTRIEVTADIFGLPLAEDEIARQYDKPSVLLQEGGQVHFQVTIPVEGVYTIAFDVAADTVSVSAPEGELRIDGDLPVNDLRRIIFPVFYRNIADTFPKDRYGNDALIRQERMVHWTKTPARDINFSQPYPLRIPFHAGEYSFDFTLRQGTVHLGSIYIETFTPHPSYAEYRTTQPNLTVSDFLLTLEAEFPSYKNDTSVRPSSSRSLTVTPYDTYRLLLNTLGGESWIKSGSAVFYEFEVPEDGLYSITLRALQDTRSNFTVFRRFTINGETPFAELNAFPFSYSTDWMDVPLGDGAPFQVFLRKGRNVLGIEATNWLPIWPAITTVQQGPPRHQHTWRWRSASSPATSAIPTRNGSSPTTFPISASGLLPSCTRAACRIKAILLGAILQGRLSSPEVITYQMAIDNLLFLARRSRS